MFRSAEVGFRCLQGGAAGAHHLLDQLMDIGDVLSVFAAGGGADLFKAIDLN